MPERRPHKRYAVDLLDVTSALIDANDMEILDISQKGISLRAGRRLNIAETYTLKIKSKDTLLTLQGTVIWSRISQIRKKLHSETIPMYTAGMEFVDVSNEKRMEIIHFIETHKQNNETPVVQENNRKRRTMRLHVDMPEEAFILNQAESHKVKQLSFSGARIRSKHPMKVNTSIPMMISLSEEKFILFQGRIASCLLIRDAYPKAYDIGIEFTELSEQEREILAEFIRLLDTIDKSPAE
jgi:hypothetical protein